MANRKSTIRRNMVGRSNEEVREAERGKKEDLDVQEQGGGDGRGHDGG